MKKIRIVLAFILCMMIFSINKNVNAAITEIPIDTARTMLEGNDIRVNTNYSSPILDYDSAVCNGANLSPSEPIFGEDGNQHRVYRLFEVQRAGASITMTYRNYAVEKSTNRGINLEMTISGLKMSNGASEYNHGRVGFNVYYPGMILFESDNPVAGSHRGSIAKITMRFYYSDDASKTYISIGNFRIGIGGFNSEKKLSNGADDNVLGAPQWEWASFQYTAANVKAYRDNICLIKKYNSDFSGSASDFDNVTSWAYGDPNHPWSSGSQTITYTDVHTSNPTHREVISNGGNRYPSILEVMTDKPEENPWINPTNYQRYRTRVKEGYWLFEVPKVNGISQFEFEFGKTFGTVELGMTPVILANEYPDKPVKSVSETVAHENQELIYTINQKTGFLQANAHTEAEFYAADTIEKYNSMEIIDDLPAEVQFVPGSVTVSTNGRYLNQGSDYTVVGPTNIANGKQQVKIQFTYDYLKNRMAYRGETYTINLKAKVKDLTFAQAVQYANNQYKIFTAPNEAKTIINNATPSVSNKVTTQIIYDILTKANHATISEKLVELEGGSNGHIVTFTPDTSYYIESVEWQTQSQRYAPTTELLSEITDIPNGSVRIPETKNGTENTYKFVPTMDSSEGDTLNYDPFGTTTYTFNELDNNHYVKVVAKEMKMVITVSKEDIETGKVTQGDAKFVGAQYTIYDDEACTNAVETLTLDSNGYANSSELSVKNYWIKETKEPEGYLIDKNVYKIANDPESQRLRREKVSYFSVPSTNPETEGVTSKELVIKSDINIIKSLDKYPETTDSDPAEGCKLYLTLDSSNGAKVYEAVIDKYGHAAFEDIPYGWYTITESEEAREAGYKLMDPEPVYIEKDKNVHKVEYRRIIEENRIEYYVRVVKKDGDSATKSTIPVANTTYKVWDYQKEEFVKMIVTPVGEISEFKTDETGEFTLPQKLPIGRYRLVELTPPEGYHLNDTDFELKDAVFENKEEEPTITVNQYDMPQKGKIRVTKKAEVLTGVKQTTDKETGLEVLTPVYEKKGLQGVTYKITAKENIVTADGTVRMSKGQAKYITTNAEGIAESEYLYLGEYEVTEYSTPTGYKLNTKVENVTLEYRTNGRDAEGKLIVLEDYTVDLAYENERMPYELKFGKTYGESEYNSIGEEEKNSVRFGLYANEDIKVYGTNNVAIKKDALLEVIAAKDGVCEAKADIPVGSYYIKEINIPNLPYQVDTNKYAFEFRPEATKEKEVITINDGVAIDNIVLKGNVRLLKITQKVYEANKAKIEEIVKTNDEEALHKLAEEFGLTGAKYKVFFKNKAGEYEALTLNGEEVVFTTGEEGLDDKVIPYGKYYVKEIEAPEKHEVDPNYIEVNIGKELNFAVVNDPKIKGKIVVKHIDIDTDVEIYDPEHSEDDIEEPYTTTDRLKEINENYTPDFDIYELVEEKIPENKDGVYEEEEQTIKYYYRRLKGKLTVIKKDAETGERLEGCIFTIEDAITGKVLVENAVTDENGEYTIEEAPYGRYVFTEVKAPEGYEVEEGSVGAVFDVKTEETIFEIVNTGDIQVIVLSIVAIISVMGIGLVAKKKLLN